MLEKNRLKNLNILIAGQIITSRTETIEDYLKDKIKCLGVIGFASPYAVKGPGRCSLYEEAKLSKKFSLPSIKLKGPKWFIQPLLACIFSIYFIFMVLAALKLKRKFDIFIGVACFSAFVGLFLKKIGIVKHLIYYTIDYYPLPKKFCFDTLTHRIIWALDKMLADRSNVVWNLSLRIVEARKKFVRFPATRYKSLIVPMAYSSKFLRIKTWDKIERWAIGFVGTLSENQGLQLLIKAMPKIIKELPQIKVKIIGTGPYENELKKLVKNSGLEKYFVFYGFIKDDNEVLEILSSSAIGIAPWTSKEDNYVLYADPGKTRLYAFCGLPTIITNTTLAAKEIEEKRIGLSIKYDEGELTEAIIKLLRDENSFRAYKNNTAEFANKYTSEKVFNMALENSFNFIYS